MTRLIHKSVSQILDCGTSLSVLKSTVRSLVLCQCDGHNAGGGDGPENHIHAHFAAATYIRAAFPNSRALILAITGQCPRHSHFLAPLS